MGVVLVCRGARRLRSPERLRSHRSPIAIPQATTSRNNARRTVKKGASSCADWTSRIFDCVVGSAPELWALPAPFVDANAATAMVLRSTSRQSLERLVPRKAVSAAFLEVGPVEITALELSARLMVTVYDALVNSGTWDARFMRGPRNPLQQQRHVTHTMHTNHTNHKRKWDAAPDTDVARSLATTYLSQASTDAWNALAGAIELARVWALRPDECDGMAADTVCDRDTELPLETRMRLAACLSVAWKFERAGKTLFYHEFEPIAEDERRGRTLELAFVAYSFLSADEQNTVGTWDPHNVVDLRELQERVLHLEIDVVCGVQTFPLLAENAQCLAEIGIQRLFDDARASAMRCMQLRALLPFFVRCALHKDARDAKSLYHELLATSTSTSTSTMSEDAAGGLLCAALLCVKHCGTPARDLPRRSTDLFPPMQHLAAWRLLDVATRAVAADAEFFRRGCYGDAGWYGYNYLTDATLAAAMRACLQGMDPRAPVNVNVKVDTTNTINTINTTDTTDTTTTTTTDTNAHERLVACVGRVCPSWV